MQIQLPGKPYIFRELQYLWTQAAFYATFQLLTLEYTYVVSFHVYLTIINYLNCIKIIRQCYVKRCVKCCVQTTLKDTLFFRFVMELKTEIS